MTKDRMYSDKELAIYEAVVDIFNEGVNPHLMKVSDIAKRADIGKGTIYDYFDSKEEAIASSLVYFINKTIEDVFTNINKSDSFEDKLFYILDIIYDNQKNKLSILKLLLFIDEINTMFGDSDRIKEDEKNFYQLIDDIVNDLLETGYNDNKISNSDNFFAKQVIKGSIFSFAHYIKFADYEDKIEKEQAKNTALNIIIRSLK